jgi:uncharacterized protein DUF3467
MADEKIQASVLTPEQVKERTTSGQMPMMYFNYARVATSFFDVRIYFGQGNISPTGEHTFQEELCVVCSLEFAKQVRDNMTSQIEAYEEKFGTLRKPPTPPTPASNGGAKRTHKKI